MADNRHSPVIGSRSRSPDRVRDEGTRDSDRARSRQRRSYGRRRRRHHITHRPSASRTRYRSHSRRGSPSMDTRTPHHTDSRYTPRRTRSRSHTRRGSPSMDTHTPHHTDRRHTHRRHTHRRQASHDSHYRSVSRSHHRGRSTSHRHRERSRSRSLDSRRDHHRDHYHRDYHQDHHHDSREYRNNRRQSSHREYSHDSGRHRHHYRSPSRDYAAAHARLITGRHTDATVPIVDQVSSRLREKILSNKCIDFAKLLPTPLVSSHQEDQSKSFEFQKSGSAYQLVSRTKTSKITNIYQWMDAFIRFVAIFTSRRRFYNQTPRLMRYAEIIRDLARRPNGLAWLEYDYKFRQLRVNASTPWDTIHPELWIQAATAASTRSSDRRSENARQSNFRRQIRRKPQSASSEFLRNTCFSYNKSTCTRNPCDYPHVCGYCRGQHCQRMSQIPQNPP